MKNALDSLVERIDDEKLRAAIGAEIQSLKNSREFGLVFERHFPENVSLPSHPIRRGVFVKRRDADSAEPIGVVKKVHGTQATISGADGATYEMAAADLVVVKSFGEAIYPGLLPVGEVNVDSQCAPHIVINGENFHALQTLLYLYEGMVDCIYIDPPYNSGARDWKYNNNYVGEDDAYRHSKWLSFMEKRISLAKRLLNPKKSVLIVAIDENEVHRLALLLEQLFPTSKIQMVSVLINPAGASIIDQFARVDEQLLFVHIGEARPIRTVARTTPTASEVGAVKDGPQQLSKPKKLSWESLQRSGGNSRREDTKAKFFPIYISKTGTKIVGCGDHLPEGVPRSRAPRAPSGAVAIWPIKTDGSEACWQLSAPTFRKYLKDGRIRLGNKKKNGSWGVSFLTTGHMEAIARGELVVKGRAKTGELEVYYSQEQARTRVGKTLWTNGAYSATEHGSTLLRDFLPGRKFPFPKSLYAVEDALRFYVGDNKNALVLDFFGGSGTTTHAVARLNHQDGGHRRSLLITNNEVSAEEADQMRAKGIFPGDDTWEQRGIFEYITKPRIEAAITGLDSNGGRVPGRYRFIDEFDRADGLTDGVRFLKLTYLDPDLVSRRKAFSYVANLLWLKAGGVGAVITDERGAFAAPSDAIYAVLFDVSKWGEFVRTVRDRNDLTHIFIVTDSRAQYEQICLELPVEIPVSMLYEDYISNFAIEVGGAS